MITARETLYALYGSWRLARMDREAIQYFERTPGGFWRSFWAAALVLPMDAVLRYLQYRDMQVEYDLALSALGFAVYYAMSWLVWPVIVSFLVELMGISDRFIDYIVALNWTSVPAQALFFAVAVLATAFLPPEIGSVMLLVSVGAILAYRGFVAAATLRCNVFAAGAFALGEFAVGAIVLGPALDRALVPAS